MSLAFLNPSAMVRLEADDSSLKDRPGYRPVFTAKLFEVCIACCYRSLYWWLLADFGSVETWFCLVERLAYDRGSELTPICSVAEFATWLFLN